MRYEEKKRRRCQQKGAKHSGIQKSLLCRVKPMMRNQNGIILKLNILVAANNFIFLANALMHTRSVLGRRWYMFLRN